MFARQTALWKTLAETLSRDASALEWTWSPALPESQQMAFESLQYGAATKAILRFAPLMTLLAGGRASEQLAALIDRDGGAGLAPRLSSTGGESPATPRVHAVSWEDEPWSRGGYAYFAPSFDPALRDLLARAAGRVIFAGSHTSREFQGYMNGAVESGHRAAAEIAMLESLAGRPRGSGSR